jgi:hypothetical protein
MNCWSCRRCGFRSPWWRGCERFACCTRCAREERDKARAAIEREPEPPKAAPGFVNAGKAIVARQTVKAVLVDSEAFGRRWLPKSAAIIENGELRMRGWLYRKLTEPAREAA